MQSVTYTTTPEDYIAYNINYADTNTGVVKHMKRMRLLCALLVFAGGNIYISMLGQFNIFAFIIYTAAAILMYWGLPKYQRHTIRKNVRRMLKNPANKHACDQRTLTLSETDIRVVGGGEDSTYTFAEAIERMQTTDTHIFIYVGEMSALIIPRAAFDTYDQSRIFAERVQQYLCD